ncbi:MAG: cell envelope integrity protein CreD [Chitinophagales bacterium]|nr:cell envelope integrity protein CreD [Chitinophagales bacterium]
MENTSLLDRINNWAKRSVMLKLLIIGILILILLIPTSMLSSLIYERQGVRDEATRDVSSKWGLQQTIGGPMITVPFEERVKNENGNIETVMQHAHFLPDELTITGEMIPEKRYRGIYVVMLYKAKLHITGTFSYPDFGELNLNPADCHLDEAYISLGIPDLKGINDAVNMTIGDSSFSFGPGIPDHEIFNSGISFKFPLQQKQSFNFTLDVNLNGSTSLAFLPFGKETRVELRSPWGTPSFEGTFLPDTRTVTDSGFTAQWKVLQLNRNYPQQGVGNFIGITDNDYGPKEITDSGNEAAFGVQLLLPIDEYQKTMRSVKYCIMFIIITFLSFFFVEVLNKKRIHAIQYLLVGSAICLFYVLLLSISEHLRFGQSYLISSVSTLTLITLYAAYIFKNRFLTLIFAGILALLYGFFYSLLQLEDYALLLGSIGLFIILATIMYLTRKVDWYGETDSGS